MYLYYNVRRVAGDYVKGVSVHCLQSVSAKEATCLYVGMFAPSSVWVFVFANVEGYENVCVSEMVFMYDGGCVPVWPGVGHVQHSVKAAEAECCCSCHSRNCDLCSPDVFASTAPASS